MDANLAQDVETIERAAWADLYAAAPASFAAGIGLKQERIGAGIALIAAKVPDTQFNRAFGFGVDAQTSEAELDRTIEAFRNASAARWWLQPYPGDHDMIRWAEVRGFTRAPRPWAKMARGREAPAPITTDLTISRIDAAEAPAFSAVVTEAFGAPPFFSAWFDALAERPGWRLYVARDGNEIVAGAALRIEGDTGWLGIAATKASARNRGAQGALMARRIEDAIDAACRVIVTETGAKQAGTPSPSYDNMIRHGFSIVHLRENLAPLAA